MPGMSSKYSGPRGSEEWVQAYIALGANVGERENNLREALAKIDATAGVKVTAVSSFLENPAVGGPPDSPAFLNAVALVQTDLSAGDLLGRLLSIEKELGRVRDVKWGPRTIDLDLLLYDHLILSQEELIVPHPRLHERLFVLKPLAELAPHYTVPGLGKTVAELLDELEKRDTESNTRGVS